MSDYIKKQYYSLRRQWKEKNKEYQDINTLYEVIEKQFIINIIKFCNDNELDNPFDKHEDVSEEDKNVGGNTSSFKSLYRKIAVHTHPDKNKNKENAREIYEKATSAKKQGNLQELLDAGKEINVVPDIESFSLDELQLLKDNILELKDKINKIHNSYPWVWFHSNPSKRNVIFYNFIESAH